MTLIRDWSRHNNTLFGYPSYDEEENCQHKVFNGEIYCRQHQNECLDSSCQRRLDSKNQYCYDHAPACQVLNPSGHYCLSKITSGDTYCSSHSKVCLVCPIRISDSSTYCYDHERACSDCSTRIAYSKYTCGSCENKNNEQERLKSLVKQRTSLSNPQEVVKFDVWFNPNCATCVNYDGYYRVFLIICEPSHKGMPEIPPQVFPRNRSTSQ